MDVLVFGHGANGARLHHGVALRLLPRIETRDDLAVAIHQELVEVTDNGIRELLIGAFFYEVAV